MNRLLFYGSLLLLAGCLCKVFPILLILSILLSVLLISLGLMTVWFGTLMGLSENRIRGNRFYLRPATFVILIAVGGFVYWKNHQPVTIYARDNPGALGYDGDRSDDYSVTSYGWPLMRYQVISETILDDRGKATLSQKVFAPINLPHTLAALSVWALIAIWTVVFGEWISYLYDNKRRPVTKRQPSPLDIA